MNKLKILPVILCGGKGERLWPLSRESFPKQFISLEQDSNKSLLQKTCERIKNLENLDNPIFICNEEHRFITAEQIRAVQVKPNSILLEPFGRGTAPAIALSASKALENGNDSLLLILSSDHVINDNDGFLESIKIGIKYALKGRLVTFGVLPTSPETGYGYIESEIPLKDNAVQASNIVRFLEKPNFNKAKEIYCDKKFTWNSGIFLFKASLIKSEINKFDPYIISNCEKAISNKNLDLDFLRINKNDFSKCPNISIDKAVFEKTNLGTVIPLRCDWKDIGSWKQVWENSKKDNDGNSLDGKVILRESKHCFVKSENRLVVGIGIENLTIVETTDAILVASRDTSEQIKSIVQLLNNDGIQEGREHKKIFRPWGNYTSLIEESNWKVKKIVVNSKQSLSLQLHNFRSENWVIIDGIAKVEIDNKISILETNQSAYIPAGIKHRLSNPGNSDLVLIEVQSGSYLEENDIVRFEDNYGRFN